MFKKLRYIHIIEYYSLIKRDAIKKKKKGMLLINTKTLVNLKVITQTEKLRQKQIHIVSLHLCKFLEDGNYSIPVVAWGQGEGREE